MVNPRRFLNAGMRPRSTAAPIEWRIEPGLTPYADTLSVMEARSTAIAAGTARELVWLIEHPPLYTAGTSAAPQDLREARFPVFAAGRGGQYTYHGPGQRVAYLMIDLKRRTPDVRAFVATLEEWIVRTLRALAVEAEPREDRVGVWVRRESRGAGHEDKIAAIGIRLRRWVSLHGVSVNVAPDLAHFGGIVPCGVDDPRYGVTSLADLGHPARFAEVDRALRAEFEPLFGETVTLATAPLELSARVTAEQD